MCLSSEVSDWCIGGAGVFSILFRSLALRYRSTAAVCASVFRFLILLWSKRLGS